MKNWRILIFLLLLVPCLAFSSCDAGEGSGVVSVTPGDIEWNDTETDQETKKETETAQTLDSNATVYITPTGTRYHLSSSFSRNNFPWPVKRK